MKYLTYEIFKEAIQNKVKQLASKTTEIYNNKCSEKNSWCLVKSYNQCLGTDEKECVSYGKAQCYSSNNYVSKSGGVRFPITIDPNQLSNQQKLFVCASTQLDITFKQIKNQMKSLTNRLYIGTYFGYFRAFPGLQQENQGGVCTQKQSDKDGYDPRTRRWYNQATTSDIKNVIIILDNTESMFGPYLYQAQKAAKDIVNSLGLEDHIGVILFSDVASYLKYQILTRASNQASTALKTAIDSITVGVTDLRSYQSAFYKAIDMLYDSNVKGNGFKCEEMPHIIVLITVGGPTYNETQPQKLTKLINEYNINKTKSLNISAFNFSLFTYAIGKNIDNDVLKNLSSKYYGTILSPNLTTSDIKLKMRSYYVYLSENTKIIHPVWSDPYIDAITNDSVVAASMPIMYDEGGIHKILGVAAVSVPMSSFSIYGVDEKIYNKKKIIHSVCQKKQLEYCQLQRLRYDNNMVINQTCKSHSDFNSTNCQYKVNSNTLLLDTPPVSGQVLFQCCPGDKAGLIAGITMGCILLVGLIVLAVCLIRRFINPNSLLRNHHEDNYPSNQNNPTMRNLNDNPMSGQIGDKKKRDKFTSVDRIVQQQAHPDVDEIRKTERINIILTQSQNSSKSRVEPIKQQQN